jgi:N-methylhydantoinase A
MHRRLTIDAGGTFTDVVWSDADGTLFVGKAPTRRDRVFRGIDEGVAVIANDLGVDRRTVYEQTDLAIYATTTATNAILERATARTALLVTNGFPDTLVLRGGGKLHPFDFDEPYPRPYVPRRMTFEIVERVDAEGGVVTPLDEEQVRDTIAAASAAGAEAVAVCLLWSIANGSHERRLGELLAELLPGVPFTLSHQLNPIVREYPRASGTAIDASLKPLMQRHLSELAGDLSDAGFTGELTVATSLGGVMHIDDVRECPIYLVRSGPSMAPVAGRMFASVRTADILVADTGGTSFDVSVLRGGDVTFTRDTWLGPQFTGHATGMASVDIRSIGAGGGSIAWIDAGGLLRVGPQSAGATPGPACYGRGGDRPTVTDAAAVLGYLDPDRFLGGRMALEVEAARRVVGRLADELEEEPEEAAAAILAIVDQSMVSAIKDVTITQGIDPRECLIVAGGGAAGLNIVEIARSLGCASIQYPRQAGALSACGAQFSDLVTEFSAGVFLTTASFDLDLLAGALGGLDTQLGLVEQQLRGRGITSFERSFVAEARYAYQSWQIDVPLDRETILSEGGVAVLGRTFDREHERVFAVAEPGQVIELTQCRARLVGRLDRSAAIEWGGGTAAPEAVTRQPAFFRGLGCVDTHVHPGSSIPAEAIIEGPALIVEPTTTLVLYPSSSARIGPNGTYTVTIELEERAA